jgi:hypothetical protein
MTTASRITTSKAAHAGRAAFGIRFIIGQAETVGCDRDVTAVVSDKPEMSVVLHEMNLFAEITAD